MKILWFNLQLKVINTRVNDLEIKQMEISIAEKSRRLMPTQ